MFNGHVNGLFRCQSEGCFLLRTGTPFVCFLYPRTGHFDRSGFVVYCLLVLKSRVLLVSVTS